MLIEIGGEACVLERILRNIQKLENLINISENSHHTHYYLFLKIALKFRKNIRFRSKKQFEFLFENLGVMFEHIPDHLHAIFFHFC